jgi:hypothetical protein
MIDPQMTTTAFTLDGFRTVRTLGVVSGISVRTRSIIGTIVSPRFAISAQYPLSGGLPC